ncbi:MAG: MFS transporter [Alistipes sp.]|nr:MFS transporter [Alistipes sp.]
MEKAGQKNFTLPIIMMFALFFMIAFVTGLQNPLGVIVKEQFDLANWQSQLGNAANFIAYAFMGIPAGMMLSRIGYKRTALTAIAVGFVGVAVIYLGGQAENFYIYLAGAFIGGFSMCMLNTVVNPMLNTIGGGGNKGNQLVQFGGSCNSLGATIVPVLGGYLMGSGNTIASTSPALWLAMGIFLLAFVVLYITDIPEPFVVSDRKDTQDKHSALSFRHFVLGTVGIFVYVGIEVGIPNIANLYMTGSAADGGLGIAGSTAGMIIGVYWLLMLVGRLIGGALGARFSSRAMLTTVSTVGVMLVILAMYLPSVEVMMPAFDNKTLSFALEAVPVNVMLLMLCGLCTSIMWGGIFNLAVEGLGKYTSMASGLFMVMVCGGGILPAIQGWIADKTNYMASYWLIVALLLYLLFYALAGSKNVNKDIPVE